MENSNSNLSANQISNSNSNSKWDLLIYEAKNRCNLISSQINSLPSSKLTDSCKQTLLRLINSELKYLTQLTFSSSPSILSLNIGYIESIIHILQQKLISKVSRVCKPSNGVYIDIVCTVNKDPVWIIVSDKSKKYVSWEGNRKKNNKGVKLRVEEVLKAAKSCLMLKPKSVLLFFGNGVDESVSEKLSDEFRGFEVERMFCLDDSVFYEEVEDDWVNVIGRCYGKAQTFQIMVDDCVENVGFSKVESRVSKINSGDGGMDLFSDQTRFMLGEKFCSLLLSMRLDVKLVEKPEDLIGEDVLNFDTTALIALVSGISNGGTEKLLATPESELRERFKINYEFVIAQVMSELQKPILEELTCVISGKIGMICESVHLEFRELVSMCGGPNEKLRAEQLIKCLLIVPDSPSARMLDILTTRKIALKNKTVFGTGDQWSAPTLTANMGFVRAISQTGMSLMTLEHRPRALTGD